MYVMYHIIYTHIYVFIRHTKSLNRIECRTLNNNIAIFLNITKARFSIFILCSISILSREAKILMSRCEMQIYIHMLIYKSMLLHNNMQQSLVYIHTLYRLPGVILLLCQKSHSTHHPYYYIHFCISHDAKFAFINLQFCSQFMRDFSQSWFRE